MTVFFSLFSDVSCGQQPMIVSDILVTSDMARMNFVGRYKRSYIPSAGGRDPHISGNTSIAGMIQKTYVIDKKHAVTFAGDLSIASNFFEELNNTTDDYNEIKEIGNKYSDQLQFLVCTFNKNLQNFSLIFSANCNKLSPGDYGLVVCGGSGESTVRSLITKHQTLPLSGDNEMTQFARLLNLISEAIELDTIQPNRTINNKFGAYYEMTFFSNGEFRKIDKVLFSYWKIIIIGKKVIWNLTKMFYHEYINNVLAVRRFEFPQEGDTFSIWQDCYCVEGFDATIDANEASQSPLLTKPPEPIAECLSIEFKGARFRVTSTRDPIVTFEKKNDRWFPKGNQKILDLFAKKIADICQ